ncbi:putative hemolysin [Pseudorhodobacter sp. 4114]|nr:putative hemolysin [Pseudorhodobacter sp. 4114]
MVLLPEAWTPGHRATVARWVVTGVAMQHDVAREISYASSASSRAGAVLIRVLENATGRRSLIRRAAGYEDEVARGRSFWDVVPERYGLSLDVVGGAVGNIPATGPLVLIANHPFGILDGLMMGHLLDQVRGDFRILANSVFRRAEALNRVVLPISFDETKAAVKLNLETRAEALRYLGQGGAIGVFPGGTVSTAARPFTSAPMDPGWRNFTAKMIARSDATVVPVFFDGHNSRLFQIASHVHSTLRLGLLIKEFRARMDEPVRVVIGQPIPASDLAPLRADPTRMMEFLRRATYDLSPRPLRSYAPGHEFEAKYKTR